MIARFDFNELIDIIKKKKDQIKKPQTNTLDLEILKSNIEEFEKIIKIINAYKLFIMGGKQDIKTFINEAINYSIEFQPYIGQEVEVCLNQYSPKQITYKGTNVIEYSKFDYAQNFRYYGKIIKRDESATEPSYIVQIFYLNRNKPKLESIELSIEKKYIIEPILPKILELKNFDKSNIIIEYLRDKPNDKFNDYGIKFDNKSNDIKDIIKDNENIGNKFYYNINNISNSVTDTVTRNDNIFELQTDENNAKKLTLKEYNKNPQFYRYKIPNEEDEIKIKQEIKNQLGKNTTDIFLNYLDMFEEIYKKAASNIRFNSQITGFIDGIIRIHKIILPIKSINELYLNDYKIDIQHKDIATKDTATELTQYKEFTNFVINYLSPNMVSSNSNLQSFILSYAENIASENFITLMDLLETCYSDKKPVCKSIKNKQQNEAVLKYINTSVNYINIDNKDNPQYEIFVQLNYVKGHMDNTNWATIKCNYNDTLLTDRFNKMFNSKQVVGDWVVTAGPFVEITNTQPAPIQAKPNIQPNLNQKNKRNTTKKTKGGKNKKRSIKRRK